MKQHLTKHLVAASLATAWLACPATAKDPLDPNRQPASISDHNVVWDSPSADCRGSMPIGNGDIGANVWVEDNGDLLFYIGKTDAWCENACLLKLGRIRVTLTPNPFAKGCTFRQELDLKNGVIHIKSATSNPDVSADLRFWIDANHPAMRITGTTTSPTTSEVVLEHWRNERKQASWEWSYSGLGDRALGPDTFHHPVFVEPDTVLKGRTDSIVWFHRNRKNEHSVWADTLKVQGLEDFMGKSRDPLQDRTFGALVRGKDMTVKSPTTLQSTAPGKVIDVSVFPLTAQTPSTDDWIKQVESLASAYDMNAPDSVWAAHQEWWHKFWNRSWIHIDARPGDDAFVVARGYALQNWITACGGRGNMPIKFNGSIFTVDGDFRGKDMGPDYRRWGPAYWWQNTRLPYWPMLAAGHYEMMMPLFEMYLDALPLARHRVKKHYQIDGAYFPETMYFWGTYRNEDHGWHPPEDKKPDEIDCKFIQYYWQGGIELTSMMLQYCHHTGDRKFLETKLLPFARQIMAFYDKRYPRDDKGKLVIDPGNALEDVWGCRNPAPEIAGLRFVLPQLIGLVTDQGDKETYTRLLNAIPDLPRAVGEAGRDFLLPAQTGKRRSNCEKPECYAIFPYRLFGVGLPDLELARETFRLSPKSMNGQPRTNGWVQDPIFAACLGETDTAVRMLVARSKLHDKGSRFPAFWGPNFDWTPDQTHGGVNMIALQQMLMQTDPLTSKIHLCPAWPKAWNCSFKLHAPDQTVVQGRVKDGSVVDLVVTPESRRKDLIIHLQTPPGLPQL
jgi:alpha-L-fucosidase 2